MSRLIKLIELSKRPKNINKIDKSINYKRKVSICSNIKGTEKMMMTAKSSITKLDTFLKKTGLFVTDKHISVNKRDEKFIQDIDRFTEPLIYDNSWEYDTINIINKMWTVIYHNKLFYDDLFDNTEANKNRYACASYDVYHQPNDKLRDLMLLWHKTEPYYSYNKPLETLKIFIDYNITDYSATCLILVNKRNTIAKWYNKDINNLKRYILESQHYIKIQKKNK